MTRRQRVEQSSIFMGNFHCSMADGALYEKRGFETIHTGSNAVRTDKRYPLRGRHFLWLVDRMGNRLPAAYSALRSWVASRDGVVAMEILL